MPLKPVVFGRPSKSPNWFRVQSELMLKTPMAPEPDRRLNKYFPSPLTVISRLAAPSGSVLRIVPPITFAHDEL